MSTIVNIFLMALLATWFISVEFRLRKLKAVNRWLRDLLASCDANVEILWIREFGVEVHSDGTEICD